MACPVVICETPPTLEIASIKLVEGLFIMSSWVSTPTEVLFFLLSAPVTVPVTTTSLASIKLGCNIKTNLSVVEKSTVRF